MKYVCQFGGVRGGCGAGAPQRCPATTLLSFFVLPTPVDPTHGLDPSRKGLLGTRTTKCWR